MVLKKIDLQKGSGEFISFAIVGVFICMLVVLMCSYIRLTIYSQKISNALMVSTRSAALCTSLEDAKEQAQRVAENSLSGETNFKNIKIDIEYVTNDHSWTSGNFIMITLYAGFPAVVPNITEKKKSTIVCIENLATAGPVIDIPPGMGLYYSVTQYDRFYPRWTRGTGQRRVADLWYDDGGKWDDGIAVYKDCYLVAVTETFGKVGDRINVVLENGITMKCIIADSKKRSECNAYGHDNGRNVIEFEVDTAHYNRYGNPGCEGWHPEIKSKVTKIINLGTNVLS